MNGPADETIDDIRRRIDEAPMSRAQIAAVAVTVAISALDGYDVLSVTFAAPAIARDWGIGKAALGIVFSAGLVGMALGSLLLAPLADRIGRRRMVMNSLVLMALGMLACALSRSMVELATARIVTGLGIGAMVAIINPLAAEFANARRRPLAVALMTIGFPFGGMAGGLAAALLLEHFDWPMVFLTGFLAAILLIPIVAWYLSEPLVFLLSRRGTGALDQVNALLKRCNQRPLAALPPEPQASPRGRYSTIFAPPQRRRTLEITLINLVYVMAVYFMLSWMPQMIVDLGFPLATAGLVGAAANLGGIGGGVLLGWLAQQNGVRPLTAAMMIGLGIAMTLLGGLQASLTLTIGLAATCGFFLFGGMAGLYATLAMSFPVAARATGVGFAIGIGRIGSAIAPALAGWLFAAGLDNGQVSLAFGICAMMAGIGISVSQSLQDKRHIS